MDKGEKLQKAMSMETRGGASKNDRGAVVPFGGQKDRFGTS